MQTTVNNGRRFLQRLRKLGRQYPSIVGTVDELITELEAGGRPGDKIAGVGFDVRKVRLPNKSARRGKSGGFRVIYYLVFADEVLLLDIYSKSEQADITLEEIRQIIEDEGGL